MPENTELADVIRRFLPALSAGKGLSCHQLYVLNCLLQCRTASLGGHADVCTCCGTVSYAYNSCRNRHCPKCQGTAREKWVHARGADLLPVKYFHVVFTLPHELNGLCMHHPRDMFNMLFRSAWETLQTFGRDKKWLGANPGATAILHTWDQQLNFHPHVHMVVPAGGLSENGGWETTRSKGRFLFDVEMMSGVFRAVFVKKLTLWHKTNKMVFGRTLRNALFDKNWVVFAKLAFGGPKSVLEYIGRYSHRVAISNTRILGIEGNKVRFTWLDRGNGNQRKEMLLDGTEFLRRFCMHILPSGFTRIRHYGMLSTAAKRKALLLIRRQLGVAPPPADERTWQQICAEKWGFDPDRCPDCGGEKVRLYSMVRQRAPPLPLAANNAGTRKAV